MNPASRPDASTLAGGAEPAELADLFDFSQRLRFRPMYVGQARRLLAGESALAADISGWAPGYPGEETLQAARMLLRQAEAGRLVRGFGVYLMVRRSDAQVLGGIGFHGKPEHGRVEVGYDVAPSARGEGYATEAVRGLTGWALQQPGVQAVLARTAADNAASLRVLEKAGFIACGGPDAEGLLPFERRRTRV
ncbi:MAG: GNAT family N-acetyltransferase [Candidatus Dormibacteraeota bacterium]|nr:GNAT family N-acetyltransferase [Candidatus Dormibacteraeota bacterium]